MYRFIMVIFLFSFLTACNTIEGMGRDIRALGDGTAKTARETKNKM